ncbi:hypothetical protein [Parerythrobacter lacustris]|uniref:Uncharacterized protein n=1 Tax=Parerythrobacter lacustris TaxID=2969984 RepID=A0ABT1XSN7_9SPHN|nr:hypothetical protein [Parerythrobacter lacustris]MCR2833956.1 hypothetical protein [Parerythrobacter lacustris]
MLYALTALLMVANPVEATSEGNAQSGEVEGQGPQLTVEAEKAPAAPKLQCRNVQEVGSRQSKRVCLTKEQWRDFNRNSTRED